MRANPNFALRNIGDIYFIVRLTSKNLTEKQVLHTNETGAMLFLRLQKDCTEKELLHTLQSSYEIDEETALSDIHEFLRQLQKLGAVIMD